MAVRRRVPGSVQRHANDDPEASGSLTIVHESEQAGRAVLSHRELTN
jgi:hypothetical protein